MAKKKIRPLQEILLDIEPYVREAMIDHDLQWGDWLGLDLLYLMIHFPDHRETYSDGSHPDFRYGPAKGKNELLHLMEHCVKKLKKELKHDDKA